MKKNRLCHILIGIIFLTWGVIFLPETGQTAENMSSPVLILTDVSGSMQDKALPFETKEQEDKNKEKCISKADVMKELLVQITQKLSEKSCKFGIYRMQHKAGYKEVYVPFLPIDNYTQEIKETIADKFITKSPVFNRRTPIADTLCQLDKNELEALKGNITILLISDGNESFYDLEKDRKNTNKQNEQVIGPLTETKKLKEKYGQALKIYTIYMEKQSDKDVKPDVNIPEGAILLNNMASAGGGKNFYGTRLLENNPLLNELTDLLCSPKQ